MTALFSRHPSRRLETVKSLTLPFATRWLTSLDAPSRRAEEP